MLAVCCVAALGMACVTYLVQMDARFEIDDGCNLLEKEIREMEVERKRLDSARARLSTPANLERLSELYGIEMEHSGKAHSLRVEPSSRLAEMLEGQSP